MSALTSAAAGCSDALSPLQFWPSLLDLRPAVLQRAWVTEGLSLL